MVAILCADPDGIYSEFEDVDVWCKDRDARLYDQNHPVVAHPPCARWSRLAGLAEHVHGIPRHDDGGLFEAVLAHVRRCGGVLEHPQGSAAWARYGIQRPTGDNGWTRSLFDPDEWVCQVAQRSYGHRARKRTWLLSVRCQLPKLKYGDGPEMRCKGVAYMGSSKVRSRTPREFAEVLVDMARSVTNV